LDVPKVSQKGMKNGDINGMWGINGTSMILCVLINFLIGGVTGFLEDFYAFMDG